MLVNQAARARQALRENCTAYPLPLWRTDIFLEGGQADIVSMTGTGNPHQSTERQCYWWRSLTQEAQSIRIVDRTFTHGGSSTLKALDAADAGRFVPGCSRRPPTDQEWTIIFRIPNTRRRPHNERQEPWCRDYRFGAHWPTPGACRAAPSVRGVYRLFRHQRGECRKTRARGRCRYLVIQQPGCHVSPESQRNHYIHRRRRTCRADASGLPVGTSDSRRKTHRAGLG